MVFFEIVIPQHIFCKSCKIRNFFLHCRIKHSKHLSRSPVAYRNTIFFRNIINYVVNMVNSESVKVKFFLQILHIINKEFYNFIIILSVLKRYKIVWSLAIQISKFRNIFTVKLIVFKCRERCSRAHFIKHRHTCRAPGSARSRPHTGPHKSLNNFVLICNIFFRKFLALMITC